MDYSFWLGLDAKSYEEAEAYRKAFYREREGQSPEHWDKRIEADGFITLHPDLSNERTIAAR